MGCQPGCVRLQTAVLAHWADATYNAGCYNPASKLDGSNTPSAHARGEAIDIGIKTAYRGRNSTGQTIFGWLHSQRARLGIVQLIYDNQIWSASNQPNLIRPYTANAHHDHVHCQLNPTAARDATLNVGIGASPTPDVPQEDDDMTEDQAKQLAAVHAFMVNLSLDGALNTIDAHVAALDKKVDKAIVLATAAADDVHAVRQKLDA